MLLVLGLLMLTGCSYGAALDGGRAAAERFTELMARGDIEQAHTLCDPQSVTVDELRRILDNNGSLLKGYQGVEFVSGGELRTVNGVSTLRIQGNRLKGRPDVSVSYGFRREGARWLITGFAIKSGE